MSIEKKEMRDKSIKMEKCLYSSKKLLGVKKKYLTDEYTFGIITKMKEY